MSEKRYARAFHKGIFVAASGAVSVVIAVATDRLLIGLILGVPLTLTGAWLAWIGYRASGTSPKIQSDDWVQCSRATLVGRFRTMPRASEDDQFAAPRSTARRRAGQASYRCAWPDGVSPGSARR